VFFLFNKWITASLGSGWLDKAVGSLQIVFAIFNTYMLLWGTRMNGDVFTAFLLMKITEIVLFIGFVVAGGGKFILMLRNSAGSEISRIDWLIVTIKVVLVVFDSAIHLLCTPRPSTADPPWPLLPLALSLPT